MLLIKNIRLVDPASSTDGIRDILIEEDRIAAITENADEAGIVPDEDTLLIDGTNLVASPGLVDVHVHFRDPGFTYKEDVLTGAAAAAAGGYTSVVCMANTNPVADSPEVIDYVIKKGLQSDIHVYQAGAVTLGMKGERLTDFECLKEAGAPGFTDDGKPILDRGLLRQAMENSARFDVPLSFHEEDPSFIEDNGINRGAASSFYSVGGSDRQAEITMIDRDLRMALETGAIINIQHISTGEGVELIRKALGQEKGLRRIHAEACPHHFSLNEEAIKEHGSMAKMNPPLRTEEDRLAIIQGLKDGTIDIIATDHAPHTTEEKSGPITKAPSGIIGLQTALALGITKLVKPGYLSLSQLIEKMSLNPAAMYGLEAGYVREGGPADLVIFDENMDWVFEKDMIRSRSVNSPFVGKRLTGKVIAVICAGILRLQ